MSSAQKYGSPEAFKLSAEQVEQVKSSGKALAEAGAKQDAAASAALKHSGTAQPPQLGRSLSSKDGKTL